MKHTSITASGKENRGEKNGAIFPGARYTAQAPPPRLARVVLEAAGGAKEG